jgi:hypothetical protein
MCSFRLICQNVLKTLPAALATLVPILSKSCIEAKGSGGVKRPVVAGEFT